MSDQRITGMTDPQISEQRWFEHLHRTRELREVLLTASDAVRRAYQLAASLRYDGADVGELSGYILAASSLIDVAVAAADRAIEEAMPF
jgi:hypothetical protein